MSDKERLDRVEAEGLKLHTPEFERQIAETMAEREREGRRFSDAEVRRRAERRERIATAVVVGLLSNPTHRERDLKLVAGVSIRAADSLMAALDKAEARDREET